MTSTATCTSFCVLIEFCLSYLCHFVASAFMSTVVIVFHQILETRVTINFIQTLSLKCVWYPLYMVEFETPSHYNCMICAWPVGVAPSMLHFCQNGEANVYMLLSYCLGCDCQVANHPCNHIISLLCLFTILKTMKCVLSVSCMVSWCHIPCLSLNGCAKHETAPHRPFVTMCSHVIYCVMWSMVSGEGV